MSWPAENAQFRRAWTGSPPLRRERPALGGTSNRAVFIGNSSSPIDTGTNDVVQRAIVVATRRAERLRRRSSILEAIGQRDAATRMAALTDDLRQVVA